MSNALIMRFAVIVLIVFLLFQYGSQLRLALGLGPGTGDNFVYSVTINYTKSMFSNSTQAFINIARINAVSTVQFNELEDTSNWGVVSGSFAGATAAGIIKGFCYAAWPTESYTPSNANQNAWSFGSDFGSDHLEAAWGPTYDGASGRDDLNDIAVRGGNAVRLYDYADFFEHTTFRTYAKTKGISVTAPISEWNLQDQNGGGFSKIESTITKLIDSFGTYPDVNGTKHDYHPAINMILVGNEPDQDGAITGNQAERAVSVIDTYIKKERESNYTTTNIPIGIPISSGSVGGLGPGIKFYHDFVAAINKTKYDSTRDAILDRYVICMNAFSSTVKEWIPAIQTYLKDELKRDFPGLLTEIGHNRIDGPPTSELQEAVKWAFSGENNMTGAYVFQYQDKSWKLGRKEGSFGIRTPKKN